MHLFDLFTRGKTVKILSEKNEKPLIEGVYQGLKLFLL